MSNTKLPALPEIKTSVGEYHVEDMREYARAAILADRERQVGDAVAWFRVENGMRVYYETKAWDDLTPLFASLPAPKAVLSRGQVIDEISPLSNNSADHDIDFAYRILDRAAILASKASIPEEATCERCGIEQSKHNDPLHWCDNQSFTFGPAAPSPDGKAEQAEAPNQPNNESDTCTNSMSFGATSGNVSASTTTTPSSDGKSSARSKPSPADYEFLEKGDDERAARLRLADLPVEAVEFLNAPETATQPTASPEQAEAPSDTLRIACITLDGSTLYIPAKGITDFGIGEDDGETYALTFKTMTRAEFDALGEFDGF